MSYDPKLTSDLDKVRFFLRDTDSSNYLFTDDEINGVLLVYDSWKIATVVCCETLAAKFSGISEDKTIGMLRLRYMDRAKKYRELAKLLRSQLLRFALPYYGGGSYSDKAIMEQDSDAIQPAFKRGMQKERLPIIDYNENMV